MANINTIQATIRLSKIEAKGWELRKDDPKIKRLAELLLAMQGHSSRPPIVKKPNPDKEIYEVDSENEILIAAKLAETQGLKLLVVTICEEHTDNLLEMEALLNEKEAKPEPKVEPKLQAKPEPEAKPVSKIDELERTIKLMETLKKVNYRELQKKLKDYRNQPKPKTNIKLNRSKAALYLELQRIEGK